jgi:hypothetical protein
MILFFESGLAQKKGLKLNPAASASQVPGIAGVQYYSWLL